jgi:hypothetical protein
MLDLKRGVADQVKSWTAEEQKGIDEVVKQVQHAMGQEVERTVAGAPQLNNEISNLITVSKRAQDKAQAAPTAQRVVDRFAAHTGALTGSGFGGYVGYQEGGVPGAIAGATIGAAVPELISSPNAKLALARALASPKVEGQIIPFAKGLFLQAFKKADGKLDYRIVNEKGEPVKRQ